MLKALFKVTLYREESSGDPLLFTPELCLSYYIPMPDNNAIVKKIRQNLLAIRQGATPSQMSERIRDLCNANGYDPVYEMVELLRKGEKVTIKDADGNELTEYKPLPATTQLRIHEQMMKYIYPQLKAVDIQGHIDANVTINVKQYSAKFEGKQTAVDADFTPLAEAAAESVKKVVKNG